MSNHLREKSGRYLFRVRVPDYVRKILGKDEIIKALPDDMRRALISKDGKRKREIVTALGTKNYNDARVMACREFVEAHKLFRRVRRLTLSTKIIPIAAVPMPAGRRKPSTIDAERAMAAWFAGETSLDRQVALTALDDSARDEVLLDGAAADDPATVHATLEHALAAAGYRMPTDPAVLAHGYQLSRLALDATARADQQVIEGTRRPSPVDLPWQSSAPVHDPHARPKTKITELITIWEARREKPNAKTRDTYERRAKAFADFLAHDDAGRVTTADVRRWLASLKADGLTAKTINDGYLAAIKSLFQAALLDDRLATNPAFGRGIALIEDRTKARSRRPYTDAEAKAILTAARGEEGSRRWLPWLMAYTGARISELAQLVEGDVHPRAAVPYLSIDADDDSKSIKNAPSRRQVPLHPALIKAGFLKFVAAATKGAPLFDDLPVSMYGKRGDAASKRYGRWTRDMGITDPRAVAHSWRHKMEDALREIDAPREVRDAILGHATPGQGSDYGAGVSLKLKAKWLAKIK
ncbi:MAG TPA: site-specific integrase [Vineibacter sp.]|nr:site-specific integrase [Vineibacter sp.]